MASRRWFDPEGRSRADIAALRVPEAEGGPEPTTALLDGSARARRERREMNRALAAAVRVLPVADQEVVWGEAA
ncbi:hypothetical protein V5P93_000357 [Actinokineospora auranticolor]|uniref:Uncharacterized protein n=1 Tax=Actinokineospora auranticolor TaxID=155976 RepID=A0A2S6GKP0_9PSEU|nr:hypothetical protein [Actinokineospora auranticolor]PPK65753.1 hypothetical protein CLV40_11212 [Actinokineospora auranticolor]